MHQGFSQSDEVLAGGARGYGNLQAERPEFFKYSVADQFEAAKYIMEYGYGRPVQPLVGAFQEQRRQILEVRWMPPDPNDRSRAVDLKPGE